MGVVGVGMVGIRDSVELGTATLTILTSVSFFVTQSRRFFDARGAITPLLVDISGCFLLVHEYLDLLFSFLSFLQRTNAGKQHIHFLRGYGNGHDISHIFFHRHRHGFHGCSTPPCLLGVRFHSIYE